MRGYKLISFVFFIFWETLLFNFFRRKKINIEGDVFSFMFGSCVVCVDRVLYLFGGYYFRGNINKVSVVEVRVLGSFFFTFNVRFIKLVVVVFFSEECI